MTDANPIPTAAHCRACGYLLRGLASTGACPECGRAFDLADPKTWTRHPRARRIWRSLRWPLAIVVLLVLASASGIGWLYWGWRQEQPAIEWVQKRPEWVAPIQVRQIGPEWLKERSGRWGWLLERAHVLCVTLDESPEAREVAQRLRWLEIVRVEGTGLTEEWIAELGKGNELKDLTLDSEAVNDAFLARLGSQKKLEILMLYSSEATDAGLAALAGFPELQELYLFGRRFTGPGLEYLRHVPKLNALSLEGTMVGDDAMPAVAKCTELRFLVFRGTRVTSSGVRELAALKNLQYLHLSDTQADDSVVETLGSMPSLKRIWIRGESRLSDEGVKRLNAALPAMEIYVEPN